MNPIMGPDDTTKFYCPIRENILSWEAKDVFNPCAVVRNGKVYMLYRAEDFEGKYLGTSRIGLAVSEDGIHFTRHGTPVLYPANDEYRDIEWEGGCEDPRIAEDENGTYYMTYTAYSGEAIYLCIATSTDLLHWHKHGPIADTGTPFPDMEGHKAATIVCEQRGEKLLAKKIDGKYWMYWGVGILRLATSTDLIHWQRVKDDRGGDLVVLAPRQHANYNDTDNVAVEAGPAALWTPEGIVVLYNGIYHDNPTTDDIFLASAAPEGNGWCGVQALFDKDDPTKLVARAEKPYLQPDRPYEIAGQIPQVTFVEGLVFFKGKWLAYYGTADSYIAVAAAEEKNK